MTTGRVFGIIAVLAAASAASASFNVESLVLEGETVPGVGDVTSIFTLAINDFGQWYVEADTNAPDTDTDYVLLGGVQAGPYGLAYREGQPLASPAGALLDSFDSININNAGNSGWNFFLDGTSGSGDDSGIYFNNSLVIQESMLTTAPGVPANTPYIGFFDAKINNQNQILTTASLNYGGLGTVDRALIRIDNPAGVYTETVVSKEGDEPFTGRFITDFGTGPHETAFNDLGQTMYNMDLDGDSADDRALFIDNTLIAREGAPSSIPGVNYQTIDYAVDLNNSGDYAFRARLDTGSTANDYAIIKNGDVFIQEGDSLPDVAPYVFTTVGGFSSPVDLDDAGNMVWYGDWDDPDTDKDTGIFYNDQLIVQEGVTMVDGLLIDTLVSGEEAFKLSNNGEWLIFEATLEGGINGAFLINIPEPGSLLILLGLAGMIRRR